jgi:hypothetical protein
LISSSSFDRPEMPILCESAYVFCEEISTCFSDSSFNNGKAIGLGGEESWGWSIAIKDFFGNNADAELECDIYVGVDSGTCSIDSGVRVGTVEIKKDSIEYLLNPGSKASSFQLYAGKCEGSDFGGHLMNGEESSCNAFDVQDNARRPASYPLSANLDSSATHFKIAADNLKTYMWGNSELNIFEQDYLSIHADVCTATRASSYPSSDPGSGATRRGGALQTNGHMKQSSPSWPRDLMPRGPTYHAISSPSTFPTSTPTNIRNVPPIKIPTAAPSSLPSIGPINLPTIVPGKFPSSWPTNLPTCRTCEADH